MVGAEGPPLGGRLKPRTARPRRGRPQNKNPLVKPYLNYKSRIFFKPIKIMSLDFLYQLLDGLLGLQLRTWLLLPLGLILLIKGADALVDGAAALAKRFQVSDMMIGLTVVSFGTSAPELLVSLSASFKGNSGIVFGNVIGSNIFNIALILGASGLIYPLQVQRNTLFKELPFSFILAVLVLILANTAFFGLGDTGISRPDGAVLTLFFAGFLYYLFKNAKENPEEIESIEPKPLAQAITLLILGFIGLVLGATLLVDNAVVIAKTWGMSDSLIGLTIIGIGTSLPELATSVMAAYRKNSDIAIGNVVGSNIFNIGLILGPTALISPIPHDLNNNVHLYVLFAFTILLFSFSFFGTRRSKQGVYTLDKWQAGLLLLFCTLYLGYLINSIQAPTAN